MRRGGAGAGRRRPLAIAPEFDKTPRSARGVQPENGASMSRRTRRRLAVVLAVAGLLVAAPAALAAIILVGDSSGTPTQNICSGAVRCTYINYAGGVPSDVVSLDGRIVSWQLRAGSVSGRVRLRVLRPLGNGQFQFVASSEVKHVTKSDSDINDFSADIPVQAGDVLGLTNVTS